MSNDKKLVTLLSTEGKSKEQIKQEAKEAFAKFRDAIKRADQNAASPKR